MKNFATRGWGFEALSIALGTNQFRNLRRVRANTIGELRSIF
jgi:hypothetical protein